MVLIKIFSLYSRQPASTWGFLVLLFPFRTSYFMAGPALISFKDLTLSFGNQEVLSGASMAVGEREKVGLVGRNGCGKSSLLRILANAERPDSGIVSRRQGLITGWLPQEFAIDDRLTVFENVRAGAEAAMELLARYESGDAGEAEEADLLSRIEALGGWDVDSRVKTAMSELSCPHPDRVARDLSGGEKRRVALARAIVSLPDLLLLDEPTNHLDTESITWLEDYLKESRSACLFVTHDRYFLDRIATRIAELDGGKLWMHEGNYTEFLTARAERQAAEAAREGRRQTFLRREIEWVRAGVKARTTKAQSRLDNYNRIAGEKTPEEERNMELLIPPPPPLGNIVVKTEGVGVTMGERQLFHGLEMEFAAGTCTGIAGRNGMGKTTLLRTLMGEQAPTEGRVTIGAKVVFNYIDQQRLLLDPEKSVIEAIGGNSDFITWGDQKLHIRSYLKRFLFTDDRCTQKVAVLSGGERSRLLLAKILCRGGNFLVLDEPTNDLDLSTLSILEEALLDFPGVVLIVSHDRWFLDRLCDRVLVFEGEGHLHHQAGNYSYYLEKNSARLAAERSAARMAARSLPRPEPERPAPVNDKPKPRRLSYKEERELEGMESAIMMKEEKIAVTDATINDPDFYLTRAAEAPALIAALEAQRKEVQDLYTRWEQLEAVRQESAAEDRSIPAVAVT